MVSGNGYVVGIVGATGAVGQEFLRVLDERKFPIRELRLWASARSEGKSIEFQGKANTVRSINQSSFDGVDFAFISASGAVSKATAPAIAEAGGLAIDDSSAFRYEDWVPLVVPEVNAEDCAWHKGIIATPNCSTTQMVLVLAALHRVNPISRVIVDTYQSVSGWGGRAIVQLREQTAAVSRGEVAEVDPAVFAHPIAFNLIPEIDSPREDGYTKEEWKMAVETQKIMHAPNLRVSATCVRVPVYRAHSEAVHVEFERPMSPDEARAILSDTTGVEVVDDLAAHAYPTPQAAEGNDTVWVGRIRQDMSHAHGLAMWIVSDNLRKGAATNSIQIAETVVQNGWLQGIR